MPLANWVLERNITTVGTSNSTRIGFSDELKNLREREEFSLTCQVEAGHKNCFLNSDTVKSKSKFKKNALLLSTVKPMRKKNTIQTERKASYLVDQMSELYTNQAKTHW